MGQRDIVKCLLIVVEFWVISLVLIVSVFNVALCNKIFSQRKLSLLSRNIGPSYPSTFKSNHFLAPNIDYKM
jgi:hypothetical protein